MASNGDPERPKSYAPINEMSEQQLDSLVDTQPNSSFQSRPKSLRSHGSGDGQRVIGNALNFFWGNDDSKELRYKDPEEEENDVAPFAGDEASMSRVSKEFTDGNTVPNGVHNEQPSTTKKKLIPHLFGQRGDSESPSKSLQSRYTPDTQNQVAQNQLASGQHSPTHPNYSGSQLQPPPGPAHLRSRNLFTFLRKKNKDRDRRPLPTDTDDGRFLQDDDDVEAGQRALGLINSLTLGSPAMNLLASCLCEDEYGIARAPLLLTLLGFKVSDISSSPMKRNRKFRIDLEYGVAPQRLKWSVEKTARDLLYLHSRFKIMVLKGTIKSDELPKYPMPPLLRRGERHFMRRSNKNSQNAEDTPRRQSLAGGHGANDLRSVQSGQSDRFSALRSQLTGLSISSNLEGITAEQLRHLNTINQNYVKELTNYLDNLINLVALRPLSNRLFYFFEVSPISSLLCYETGYTGKQGSIHVGGTAKSQGWRVGHFRANDLKEMIDRRSEKWFLVRNSYVMYVSDINSTTPLEVFMVDPKFKIYHKHSSNDKLEKALESDSEDEAQSIKSAPEDSGVKNVHKRVFKHLRIVLENSERKLVILPKSQREQKLWLLSLNNMVKNSIWSQPHRLESFAPVRQNCFAQWFVDARDYFWAVSSAIEMAKDTIFIHDWWLSPELYLRRPANGNQQFRIDRLLQRKAKQGVKIFVIIYRNVGTTIPIDSLWTKHSLLSLNQENIHIIRSPNQLLQNTYFWAHHEKICIVDNNVAFMGGIDLCYGRYDTPDHVLADDTPIDFSHLDTETLTQEEFANFQVFPGKDYSNTRVKDFSNLDKPYEDMYDRMKVPRMPWHDIHMVTLGQPARDLSRHFVQRWNYLIRQKRPSRLTPLLTPPPDLSEEEVRAMGFDGKCEVQILRSAGNWSLGLENHEQSIQNAYLKLIETSEHFVYIENQFFVTSCFIDGTEIANRVGDALVDRIIRAHNEGTQWKAIILIPLVPGFESSVDKPDGSSVRVVMQCQYMSISRGASCLFAKLRKYGIDPDNYIQFFSLRKWGRIGKDRDLVTEQLYIHAKAMVVDDRVAIIGSANINERSMRGFRDSEVAAIVRDRETITTTLNGEKKKVGKFPHTLRLRLMREHLGICIDVLDVVERVFDKYERFVKTPEGILACTNDFKSRKNREISAVVELASRDILNQPQGTKRWREYCKKKGLATQVPKMPEDVKFEEGPPPATLPLSFNNRTGPHEANQGVRDKKKHSYDPRVQHNEKHERDIYGIGTDKYRTKAAKKARLDSARFIKNLAHEVFDNKPDATFLPDIENVMGFLNLDDHEYLELMDEETEEFLTERNTERWVLLKRIAYLQRMAAKEAKENLAERARRVNAGLSPSVYDNNDTTEKQSHKPLNSGTATDISEQIVNSVEVGENESGSNGKVEEESPISAIDLGVDPSDHVPIMSLDESRTRETIRQINMPGDDNISKFIDPYGFEDPLDPDFYEDIWYENARRNTEIFRRVFHVQPDDEVVSWKDYKHFSKLQNAFKAAQDQESKHRREKFRFDSGSSTDVEKGSSERARPETLRRGSQSTINMSEVREDKSIFGNVPSSANGSTGESFRLGRAGKNKFGTHDMIQEAEETNANEEKFVDANGIRSEDEDDLGSAEEDDEEDDSLSQTEHEAGLSKKEVRHRRMALNKKQRKRRAGTFSARRKAHAGDNIFDRDSAERLLHEIHGNLVLFPADWLMRELEGGNWFFNTDRIPPIEIYD